MEKRERQQNRHKAQLRELEADIDNVKAMARRAGTNAKAEYREHVGELEKKLEIARGKAAGLRGSTGDAWDGLRASVELAIGDVRGGISDARKALAAK